MVVLASAALLASNGAADRSIVLGMKFRTAIALFVAGACLSALAVAQNTTAPDKNSATKMDALAFVQTAADVAINLQYGSLNDHIGIYIDSKNWAAALKDGDLGPFLKAQEAKPDRSASCFFHEKDSAVCVYFDGEKAYGSAAAHAGANGKIEEKDIAAGYKKVTKELLEKSGVKLRFQEADGVNTDEGVPLPAYQVTVSPLG